mmetsp:Transcript_11357/g.23950  ORF Transcript_11357/g.23950 Transcript_11357/m.23950 type:complete len:117 (-) Transcript_11357:47-397(-)
MAPVAVCSLLVLTGSLLTRNEDASDGNDDVGGDESLLCLCDWTTVKAHVRPHVDSTNSAKYDSSLKNCMAMSMIVDSTKGRCCCVVKGPEVTFTFGRLFGRKAWSGVKKAGDACTA